MTHDIHLLTLWIQGCLILAAISTTAFPVLYAFAPWWSTRLGRGLMIQGIAFALAIDLTLLFTFWETDNILLLFWVNAVVLTLLAFASGYLTWKMLKHNVYIPMHKKRGDTNVRQLRAASRRRRKRRRRHSG